MTGKIKEKKIVLFGYGSQGRAHALNLRDSGCDVTVCLRPGSPHRNDVKKAGIFLVTSTSEAAKNADIAVFLIPDTAQKELYNEVRDFLPTNSALLFASGFNVHYGLIEPRADLDVLLAAPKIPGEDTRRAYLEKTAIPILIAIHQDRTGFAWEVTRFYAANLGSTDPHLIETTFREETETDLLSEQVLIGGLAQLLLAAYDTLVAAGHSPQVAHDQCFKKTKTIAGMFAEYGIEGAFQKMSETARLGAITSGPRVIDRHVKETIQKIMTEIRNGGTLK